MCGQHMCDQAADERGSELKIATLSESAKLHTFLCASTNPQLINQIRIVISTDVPNTRTDYFWGVSSVATGKIATMADHFELGCQTLCAT